MTASISVLRGRSSDRWTPHLSFVARGSFDLREQVQRLDVPPKTRAEPVSPTSDLPTGDRVTSNHRRAIHQQLLKLRGIQQIDPYFDRVRRVRNSRFYE